MSIGFKDDEGNIFYVGMAINCQQIFVETTDDGYVRELRCISKEIKPECNDCSLVNPNR